MTAGTRYRPGSVADLSRVSRRTQAKRLRAWRYYAGKTGTATDNAVTGVAAIGDSTTEGYSAGYDSAAVSTPPQLQRWATVCVNQLNRLYGFPIAGGSLGLGYMCPGNFALTTPNWSTVAGAPTTVAYGWSQRNLRLAVGDAIRWVGTTGAFLIYYSRENTTTGGGASTIRVVVDGGAPTDIVCQDGGLAVGQRVTDGVNGAYAFAAPAVGVHTIDVSCIAGPGTGGATFAGICAYGANSPGFWLANAGRSGGEANPDVPGTSFDVPDSTALLTGMAALGNFLPIGVIINALGLNDFNGPGGANGYYQAMVNIINRTKAQVLPLQPSSVVSIPWPCFALTEQAWQPFRDAAYAAAETTESAVFDMTAMFGNTGNTGAVPNVLPPGLIAPDGIHPGPAGHVMWGRGMASFLSTAW